MSLLKEFTEVIKLEKSKVTPEIFISFELSVQSNFKA
jgi:hypothetical protein